MPWLRMVGHPHYKTGRAKEKGRCADGKQRNRRARAGTTAAARTGHPVPWPSLRAAMDLCVSPTFLFWASLAACVLVLRHDAHLRGTPASLPPTALAALPTAWRPAALSTSSDQVHPRKIMAITFSRLRLGS